MYSIKPISIIINCNSYIGNTYIHADIYYYKIIITIMHNLSHFAYNDTRNHHAKPSLTSSSALLYLSAIKNNNICRHSTKLINDPCISAGKALILQNSIAMLISQASNCREHFVVYHQIVNTMSDFKSQYNTTKEAKILFELSKFILNLHIDFQNYNDALNELVFLVFQLPERECIC